MNIDQLSARTGMSVRNIRAHQSRGLLSPPRRAGRAGVYGEEHVERIRRIQELQHSGFNLAAIQALLAAEAEGDVGRRLQRLALAPLLRHEPLVLPRAELAQMFKILARNEGSMQLSVEHGLARDLGGDLIEVTSGQLAAAGRELVSLGFTAFQVLELQTSVMDAISDVAQRFVDLSVELTWDPFEADGYPAERWDEVRQAFQALLDQMSLVVMSTFSLTVRAAAERRLADKPLSREGATG